VGLLGQDGAGDEVHALFHQAGMSTDCISREAGRPTPMKTRIMAGGYESTRQQVVRLDREPEGGISGAAETRLIERLEAVGANADGFLVSDYGYGTVTPRVYETVLELGRARQVPVTVDSRYELPRFKGATAATPNEPEVEALTGTELGDERAIEKAGRQVLERLEARLLLVTRGSRGMALFERDGPVTFVPIFGSDQIADVTGAGDTVISAFTAALAVGAPPAQAAWLANVAGGLVVMKRGTATVTPADFAQALAAEPRPDGPRPRD